MVKIIDNTKKKVEFKDLLAGDFFTNLGELYVKTEEVAGYFNSYRVSDGTPVKKSGEARVTPVDVEITINDRKGLA